MIKDTGLKAPASSGISTSGLLFQSLDRIENYETKLLKNDQYNRPVKVQTSKLKEIIFNQTKENLLTVEIDGSASLTFLLWNKDLEQEFST
jgi:hypothetical protein